MQPIPGLNLIERLAMRILHRSPRTGLVIVKPLATTLMTYSVHQDDVLAVAIGSEVLGYGDDETTSMKLERLYHQPSYGEDDP
jgi:hypothetical protein